jgi:hypothetical protein
VQIAGNKAAAILGISDRVSSAKAGAETISVIKVDAKVRIDISVKIRINVSIKARIEVSVKAGIKVDTEAGIATTREIRKTGLIIRVFKRFKVKVGSSSKS